ncbi:hypothetical protein CEXT_726131 [Caerostris extrusa]|uniref:DSL domain-containing protein n=1 Tax=Caerostris extrusa TaxID=172846 RepID=A0AAV4NRC1_CAEEX|nr:hypothetical protein CEXT_726131 [Caerostris extrusa]
MINSYRRRETVLSVFGVRTSSLKFGNAPGTSDREARLFRRADSRHGMEDKSHRGRAARISYRYRVLCSPHYYDYTCAKCRPRNDRFGHYKCVMSKGTKCVWKGIGKVQTAKQLFANWVAIQNMVSVPSQVNAKFCLWPRHPPVSASCCCGSWHNYSSGCRCGLGLICVTETKVASRVVACQVMMPCCDRTQPKRKLYASSYLNVTASCDAMRYCCFINGHFGVDSRDGRFKRAKNGEMTQNPNNEASTRMATVACPVFLRQRWNLFPWEIHKKKFVTLEGGKVGMTTSPQMVSSVTSR